MPDRPPHGRSNRSERLAVPLLRLRRRPQFYWLLAAVCAAISGAVVFAQLRALADEREQFGTTIAVPVAVSALPIGASIDRDTFVYELWPTAFLPTAEIATSLDGRTVVAGVAAGEIIMEQRLAPGIDRPLIALTPPGHRVLALPVGDAALPLEPGDRVEIVRTVDVFGVDADAAVIGIGTIVETSESRVSIGVPAALVRDVVAGVHTGTIELALIRPGESGGSD